MPQFIKARTITLYIFMNYIFFLDMQRRREEYLEQNVALHIQEESGQLLFGSSRAE